MKVRCIRICGAARNFIQTQTGPTRRFETCVVQNWILDSAVTKGSGSMMKSFALLVSRSARGRPVSRRLLKGWGTKPLYKDIGGIDGALVVATSEPVVQDFSQVPVRKREGEGAHKPTHPITLQTKKPNSAFSLTNALLQIRVFNQIRCTSLGPRLPRVCEDGKGRFFRATLTKERGSDFD